MKGTTPMKRGILFCAIGGAFWSLAACAEALDNSDTVDWTSWLEKLQTELHMQGISRQTLKSVFEGMSPDERVLKADWEQPEFIRPIWEYLDIAVSEHRIRWGREMLTRHRDLLSRIVREYGVDAEILVAIWGIETNYGSNKGEFLVPRSLATLAYGGMRQTFGRTQLLAAMHLLQEGVLEPEEMVGSWAGAIGHMQFLPTTYKSFGIDYDADGKRNLVDSEADALASAAGYLEASGWRSEEAWGMEVILPEGFDYGLARATVRKTGKMWEQLGVRGAWGALPAEEGFLLLPAGHQGAAFLVLENFAVLKVYNPSSAYALAVGLLADCLRGCMTLAGSWPVGEGILSREEKKALQKYLTELGYDTNGIDGIVGPATRGALREWQFDHGTVVDGYPTQKLLRRLKEGVGE